LRGHAFEIRPARADEVDAVRRLVRRAYAIYVPRIGREPAPMGADYAALVRAGAVTVAADQGAIVGVLVLRAQLGSLLLENVAVAPAEQRRGIGRALIAFAEERARELNLGKVTLYTNARMTENLSLYRRLGYVEVGRRREDGFERVFFEKIVEAGSPGVAVP
jgi:ribosomal protein S18 acetylase RimI-like enzyme